MSRGARSPEVRFDAKSYSDPTVGREAERQELGFIRGRDREGKKGTVTFYRLLLNVLMQHVLGEEIRDHQEPERVRRENLRRAGGLQTPLEHPLDGVRRPGPIGEGAPSPLAVS